MEEFQEFILNRIRKSKQLYFKIHLLIGSALLFSAVIGAILLGLGELDGIYMLSSSLVFGLFSLIFIPFWKGKDSPEKSGVYKILFQNSEDIKSYRFTKVYWQYQTYIEKEKGIAQILTFTNKKDLYKFVNFMDRFYPQIERK